MRHLYRLDTLRHCSLQATDGEIGKLKQVLFDDRSWAVRYFVVQTGSWLFGREVLIVPDVVTAVDEEQKALAVELSREQIEHAPPLEKDQPVSRHYEQEYYLYYNWQPYWMTETLFASTPPAPPTEELEPPAEPENPHLRSSAEVEGYHIAAVDGEIGHVEDFLLDDQKWLVNYLVVDTRNWLPGKKVLLSPAWVDQVAWTERKVSVELERELVETAPEYSSGQVVSRDYQLQLFKHYGKVFEQD